MFYQIPEAKIAHEFIEGEVIIIHFDEGNYYSLKGTAAQLWDLMAKKTSRQGMLQSFGELTPEQEGELQTFFDYLVAEGLVVGSETLPEDEAPAAGISIGMVYQSPKIDKYDDMQQLLSVDPIHEVSEEGWPELKQA